MKVCILCNGAMPSQELLAKRVSESSLFIACDGAANQAYQLGIIPHRIIGDLDSIDEHLRQNDTVHHISEQESNDLAKALNYAITHGAREVCLLGALGLRFDHALANVYVSAQFCSHVKIKLYDNYGRGIIADRHEQLALPTSTAVSLFALGKEAVRGLNLSGFKYSLNNATLEPGSPSASLNVTCSNSVQITHESGILFIFIAQ